MMILRLTKAGERTLGSSVEGEQLLPLPVAEAPVPLHPYLGSPEGAVQRLSHLLPRRSIGTADRGQQEVVGRVPPGAPPPAPPTAARPVGDSHTSYRYCCLANTGTCRRTILHASRSYDKRRRQIVVTRRRSDGIGPARQDSERGLQPSRFPGDWDTHPSLPIKMKFRARGS